MGLGAMVAWISLTRYLEYSRDYSIISRTVRHALPVVLRTMLSVIPFLCGFALLGMCLFWESNRFDGFSISLFTLYAVMNGDMIYDTFHDLNQLRFLVSQIYMYCFVFFSICVFQNMFITLVEDGYISTKYKSKFDWLEEGKDPFLAYHGVSHAPELAKNTDNFQAHDGVAPSVVQTANSDVHTHNVTHTHSNAPSYSPT